MQAINVVVPGSIAQRTGGYVYDARVVDEWRASGRTVHVHELEDDFPHPSDGTREQAARLYAGLPDASIVVTDALAGSVLPDVMERESARLELVALVHHPLALETGVEPADALRLAVGERRALSYARHVIATSPVTARELLDDYGIRRERLTVAEPGTDRAKIAPGSGADSVTRLLCVATLTPRKGHAVLLEAFAALLATMPDNPVRLDLVGSVSRAPDTAAALAAQIERLGLSERVTLHGEVDPDTLEAHYAHCDAFVLASFHEGFGMVLTEALARGLPIVATRGGAIADTVPADAALLVEPGDADALNIALQRLVSEPGLYRQLRAAALDSRKRLTSWQACAHTLLNVLDGLHR